MKIPEADAFSKAVEEQGSNVTLESLAQGYAENGWAPQVREMLSYIGLDLRQQAELLIQAHTVSSKRSSYLAGRDFNNDLKNYFKSHADADEANVTMLTQWLADRGFSSG
jgi:hypothetical protein